MNYGHKEQRDSAYNFSSEDLERYCDFVGIGRDGVPEFRLKPEFKEHKKTNTGLAVIFKLFGL